MNVSHIRSDFCLHERSSTSSLSSLLGDFLDHLKGFLDVPLGSCGLGSLQHGVEHLLGFCDTMLMNKDSNRSAG